ncbi:helix-turn-helix domain-containing protein [Streptomyces sp. NBC_00996]|uniref:helix-turn-helix domain-containing protein n=1 Tax=Streptomyces sp. NBC_00996 TaxID=2903710 RepID=UPI003867E274|nr:helix-turn-helix domain-containing protein [Streptomyces sp. NBC_00996]
MPRDLPEWITERRRELGDRIRELRLHANYTQEAFAEITGIDRRTLQRIEAGESDPRYGHLLRIAAVLDTRVSVLVD